jgi:UDPglucose 6-dehydrogenase
MRKMSEQNKTTMISSPGGARTKKPLYRLGVIGGGFIGSACRVLECASVEVFVFDIDPSKQYATRRDTVFPQTLKEFVLTFDLDVVLVCVPTPMKKSDGSVHTAIVEKVVREMIDEGAYDPRRIVIRSTVPPGTTQALGVNFMPEFLTERRALKDFAETRSWIIGTSSNSESYISVLADILKLAAFHGKIQSDDVIYTTATTAELLKYMRNGFLATKVSFCNEFERLASALGVDYRSLRALFSLDARIGCAHTYVPGPDGQRGYGGTCFPKDLNGISHVFKDNHIECPVVEAVLHRNENIDRPMKEYLTDEGRVVCSGT